jgi:hypothetical protein
MAKKAPQKSFPPSSKGVPSPIPGLEPPSAKDAMTEHFSGHEAVENHATPADSGVDRIVLWTFLTALLVRVLSLCVAPNSSTDALSRLQCGLAWVKNPTDLPPCTATEFSAWLPLHPWLLGATLQLWNSEWSARALTVLLGSLTIFPYWGIVRRAFGRRVALASTICLALFGFHIAFSVTTSVEVPTLFFMISGTYFWLRFRSNGAWKWCIASAAALTAASLCRFEPWVAILILGVLLLDWSRGWVSILADRAAWVRMIGFGSMASSGAIAWTVFSYFKWGDPLELAHRSVRLIHALAPVLRHSLPFRLAVVPVSLVTSLSPPITVLAAAGVLQVFRRGEALAKSLAVLGMVLFAANYFNAVAHETTQARYTLMYSWLLVPFAFEGLRWASILWRWADSRKAYAGLVACFLVWQAGIIVAAQYGQDSLADRLGSMSPMLPFHVEIRHVIHWLREHKSDSDAFIFDEFSYESPTIVRYSTIDPSQVFQVRGAAYSQQDLLNQEVMDFIRLRHPRFLICSPYGPIGGLWSIDDHESLSPIPGITLHLQLKTTHWRIYTINYSREGSVRNTHLPLLGTVLWFGLNESSLRSEEMH